MNSRVVLFFVFFADVVLQQDQIKTLALLTQPQGRATSVTTADVLDLVDGGDGSTDAEKAADQGLVVELDAEHLNVAGERMAWPPDPSTLRKIVGNRPVDLRIARGTAFERYWQLRTALGEADVRIVSNA